MPQKRSALKELRKAKKRHRRNVATVSETRTLIRQFSALISEKKLDEAKAFLRIVSSRLDKAATKGIIRKNTVSRNSPSSIKKAI